MQTKAENPGNAKFSYRKYYPIRKLIFHSFSEKYNADMLIEYAMKILKYGDTQPAYVCSLEPLTVIAYSDEMDAVVRLKFPNELADKYELREGTRLVTSCVYSPNAFDTTAKDIFPGEHFTGNYSDFIPAVQLFLCKHDEKIRERTALFPEELWEHVAFLGKAYIEAHPTLIRDGFSFLKK